MILFGYIMFNLPTPEELHLMLYGVVTLVSAKFIEYIAVKIFKKLDSMIKSPLDTCQETNTWCYNGTALLLIWV